jgi:ferredoxin
VVERCVVFVSYVSIFVHTQLPINYAQIGKVHCAQCSLCIFCIHLCPYHSHQFIYGMLRVER